MGIRAALRLVEATREVGPVRTPAVRASRRTGIVSPWAIPAPNVAEFLFPDYVDDAAFPVSRGQALSLPPVKRGVRLMAAAVAHCPLVNFRGDEELPLEQTSTWAYATSGVMHPALRMKLTATDLIFDSMALWSVSRSPSTRQILSADYVPFHTWTINSDDVIEIDGEAQDADKVVLIETGETPFLTSAARTIRGAIAIEDAWQKAVRNPSPHTVLKQTTDDQLEEEEITELLTDWITARQSPDGAVSFLPYGLDADFATAVAPELLESARNAVSIDIARHLGIPAVALDAGPIQSSLTYANQQTQGGLAVAVQGISPLLDVISWRLSMDDVVPRGQRMVLDATELYEAFERMNRTSSGDTRD